MTLIDYSIRDRTGVISYGFTNKKNHGETDNRTKR